VHLCRTASLTGRLSSSTSIVAQAENGTMFHSRNLDYDIPLLRNMTIQARCRRCDALVHMRWLTVPVRLFRSSSRAAARCSTLARLLPVRAVPTRSAIFGVCSAR
jgi:hypothetical protein